MSARANRQPSPASGNYAKYVGRVGALAVALGIGAVVATGHGFCLEVARADTGSETAGNPSGGDDKKDPADNKPEDKKPDEKKPEDKPEEKKPEEKPEDKKPEEKPGNEPGTGLQGEPEVKPPAVPETNEPPLVTGGGEPAPVPEPHVGEPEGPDVPEVPDIPKIVDGHIDPPRNDSAQQPPAEAPTPPGSSIGGDATAARFAAGGQQPKVSARGLGPSDEQLQPTTMSVTTMTMAVTAPEPAPTPQVRPLQEMVADVVGATQAFVAALLTPFLSPSTPAPPPTLWAVLGWVRREFERAFLNRRPEALPDDVTTSEDGSTTIDVLHNDRDDAGDVTTVVSNTEAEHGTVTLNPDGTFTYTPDPDFHGTDSFTYTITDATSRAHIHGLAGLLFGGTHTSTATVTITVTAKPDAPVANPDTYETDEDTPLTVDAEHGVLHNDTDADGDTLTVQNPGTPITTTNGGTVTIAADGSFTYVPKADATGTDAFGYTVIDGTGRSSGAIATVTVVAQPDGPVASPDAYQTDEDTQLFIDGSNGLLSNDVHPDGGSLYVPPGPSLVPTANGGTVTLHPDGAFVYTPKADFVGTDTFTYTVMDLEGRSTTGTVSITVAAKPDAPVAEPDVYETDEDDALTVDAANGLLGNDSDADGDTLTVRNPGTVSTTGGGTVTINADGSFTYTPKAGFHGEDTFVYKVGDGTGLTATATATITVAAKPDSPVSEPDAYETDEDAALTVDAADGLLGNDSDADGDTLTVRNPGTFTTTGGGTVTINADGSFTYTPKADFHGEDTFVCKVGDGTGLTATATATITVAAKPDSPVSEPDAYETDEDTPLTVDAADGLLGNDSDADGDTLTVRNPGTFTTTGGGTVTINADGSFAYTPKADFHGEDTFVYKIGDGTGLTATATATITVNPLPDVLVAEHDSYSATEDTTLTVDAEHGVLSNDSRGAGATLEVVDPGTITTSTGGTVTLNADGSFTYHPVTNWYGKRQLHLRGHRRNRHGDGDGVLRDRVGERHPRGERRRLRGQRRQLPQRGSAEHGGRQRQRR